MLVGRLGAERADVDPVLAAGREADRALAHEQRAVADRAAALETWRPVLHASTPSPPLARLLRRLDDLLGDVRRHFLVAQEAACE